VVKNLDKSIVPLWHFTDPKSSFIFERLNRSTSSLGPVRVTLRARGGPFRWGQARNLGDFSRGYGSHSGKDISGRKVRWT
jgi:hypothetical protein